MIIDDADDRGRIMCLSTQTGKYHQLREIRPKLAEKVEAGFSAR